MCSVREYVVNLFWSARVFGHARLSGLGLCSVQALITHVRAVPAAFWVCGLISGASGAFFGLLEFFSVTGVGMWGTSEIIAVVWDCEDSSN